MWVNLTENKIRKMYHIVCLCLLVCLFVLKLYSVFKSQFKIILFTSLRWWATLLASSTSGGSGREVYLALRLSWPFL